MERQQKNIVSALFDAYPTEGTLARSMVLPLTTLRVARDVRGELGVFGVQMPEPHDMASDAHRLAAASSGHAWRDREATDFLQEFAKRVWTWQGKRALDWNLFVRSCFRLMGQGRDAGGDRRIRGARDLNAPARGEDGLALHETIAAPGQERRAELDKALPEHVEGVADFLRDAPSKTIAEARGVSARMGRYDTAKLIRATAEAVRDPGLFGSLSIGPEAWASRPKTGRGGRPSKAALAKRQAAQARQAGLF
ncbi:hypothetical protein THIX_90035 [Thiomonas sp. X19]|uniref:hypothetical protein n=1 Tax=Thiomonas sp. X19 TaxID=1050370 RepID=UPI000B700602|nr:hypothetical protein [Thiomonas sp. X19]SCC95266.1 hypothetical protein THIX_90035 [Thiomonas sp. X19]